MNTKTPTEESKFPAFVTKYEIAAALEISISTLQELLNRKYKSELAELGYQPESKKVSRRVLIFLQEKIALIPEDFKK